jgi:NTP pyrophosphatase (non-canonical NTP hydrolase)
MSELKDLQKRALEVRQKYNELNQHDGHETWDGKAYAMGFVGDVGDLVKLIMAQSNLRTIDDSVAKLNHELADCLWSLLVLANHYDVDLEAAFFHTMEELDTRIAGASS